MKNSKKTGSRRRQAVLKKYGILLAGMLLLLQTLPVPGDDGTEAWEPDDGSVFQEPEETEPAEEPVVEEPVVEEPVVAEEPVVEEPVVTEEAVGSETSDPADQDAGAESAGAPAAPETVGAPLQESVSGQGEYGGLETEEFLQEETGLLQTEEVMNPEDGGTGGERSGNEDPDDSLDTDTLLAKYAEEYGISDYLPWLYGIMLSESGGVYHPDGGGLMGISNASGGISIGRAASVREGCRVFRTCLDRADAFGCDLDTAVQAYNYGISFVDYVAVRGGMYTLGIAQSFAREKSGGATVSFSNPIAVEINGGWMYRYGCMFYVPCVHAQMNGTDDAIAEMKEREPAYMLTLLDNRIASGWQEHTETSGDKETAPGNDRESADRLLFWLLGKAFGTPNPSEAGQDPADSLAVLTNCGFEKVSVRYDDGQLSEEIRYGDILPMADGVAVNAGGDIWWRLNPAGRDWLFTETTALDAGIPDSITGYSQGNEITLYRFMGEYTEPGPFEDLPGAVPADAEKPQGTETGKDGDKQSTDSAAVVNGPDAENKAGQNTETGTDTAGIKTTGTAAGAGTQGAFQVTPSAAGTSSAAPSGTAAPVPAPSGTQAAAPSEMQAAATSETPAPTPSETPTPTPSETPTPTPTPTPSEAPEQTKPALELTWAQMHDPHYMDITVDGKRVWPDLKLPDLQVSFRHGSGTDPR